MLPLLAMSCATPEKRDAATETGVNKGAYSVHTGRAYLGAYSVGQGGSIDVYVSTSGTYRLRLVRIGIRNTHISTSGLYTGSEQRVPAEMPWRTRLDWTSPVSLSIPTEEPSGYYQVSVMYDDGSSDTLPFIVREDDPGSTSPLLVLDNATTRVAYNNWGGKSTYSFNSEGEPADVVNLYRPGNFLLKEQQKNFIRWAEQAGITVEWASSLDWHYDHDLFESYETIILVEHSEYWTLEMRNQMDEHLARGGHLLSLSGNTAWWQIRIEDDQMAAYKWAGADPLYGHDDPRVTTNFWQDPVNDPENRTTGVSYRRGGYHNANGFYMAADGYGGYDIERPEHPLLAGTGLDVGDTLGTAATIVGYEADGAEFVRVDGVPVVTGADGTPTTLEIVATAPAATPSQSGTATLVAGPVGDAGGQLVNTATVDWADGLWDHSLQAVADPLVGRVTFNALRRMSPGSVPACPDGCHGSAPSYNDADTDGFDDFCDTCVLVDAPQTDTDGDGTGDFCDVTPPADPSCGAPLLSPAVDRGLYLWRDCEFAGGSEKWSLRFTAGGAAWTIYQGAVVAGAGDLAARAFAIDSNDSFDTVAGDGVVDFRLGMGGSGIDGFNVFPEEGQDVCLYAEDLPDGAEVYLGATRQPVSLPFNLNTFEACD